MKFVPWENEISKKSMDLVNDQVEEANVPSQFNMNASQNKKLFGRIE